MNYETLYFTEYICQAKFWTKQAIDSSMQLVKLTKILDRYIPIEEIPIQYGGFKRENDFEFSTEDGGVSELVIKAGSTAIIEIPAPQVREE